MTRWEPRYNKQTILDAFAKAQKENRNITSFDLAHELGCNPAYVRATLARAGIALPKSKKQIPSLCGINRSKKKIIRKNKLRRK